MNRTLLNRITQNAVLLALTCLVGMFSIPLGANVKVSLQFLAILLVSFLSFSWVDSLIISLCYLLLGLFLPFYAGFSAGISPTFGFVAGFVVAAPVISLLNRLKLKWWLRMGIAGLAGLLIVYIAGTAFMMVYLSWGLGETLLVSVVPYIPFDIAKIVLAVLLGHRLEIALKREPKEE